MRRVIRTTGEPLGTYERTTALPPVVRDEQAIHRAQLADMPLEAICTWLREQGHGDVADVLARRVAGETVLLVQWGRAYTRPDFTLDDEDDDPVRERAARFAAILDRLPPGYPPRAEDDLPFDAAEDTRS